MALGHKSRHNLKSNHDTAKDNYAAVLNDELTTDAGSNVADDASMTDLTQSIQGVFEMIPLDAKPQQSKNAQAEAKGFVQDPKPKLVQQAKQTPKLRLPTAGKVGHINVSAAFHTTNQTQVEEAAVSLPMASFALEEPKPVKNNTKHKFPGNATQKVAWEKKEASLEKEVETLKARLSNASKSVESSKLPSVQPAATGTFNAQVADGKRSNKFMAVNAPQPLQPLQAAATMTSVAAPVAEPVAAEAPQNGASASKVAMGSTFTGSPAKKVESVLALDASVVHDAVAFEGESSSTSTLGGWFSSFFSWFGGKPSPTPVVKQVPAPNAVAPTKVSLLKQDSERTLQAVQAEHLHDVEVNDAWSAMEQADDVKEQTVHDEDAAERARAETRELPHTPTKTELKGRHGHEMSSFWKQLEKEDYNIEQTVSSDDLVKYAELTQAQDTRVSEASDALSDSKLNMNMEHHASSLHSTDTRLAIHEPWLRREARDKALERQVHDSPDLQMLQLQHHHERK